MSDRGQLHQHAASAPDADVCELLRGMLVRAEAGEIVGVGLVGELRDGGVATAWSGVGFASRAKLHYGASCLVARLLGDVFAEEEG